jgi:hypothetical protein
LSFQFGYCDTEKVEIEFSVCSDGEQYTACMTGLKGLYSIQVDVPNDVTGIGGNTTEQNFCAQVTDISELSFPLFKSTDWYMSGAIREHELVHHAHQLPDLKDVALTIADLVSGITETDFGQGKEAAKTIIRNTKLPAIENQSLTIWSERYRLLAADDHDGGAGRAYIAEKGVTGLAKMLICGHAEFNWNSEWGKCTVCKP